ncbi:NAD(P) transhydrogenase subunit alpha [Persicobacter psychrovividus]|uniref:proton-translocating NAD(P)(+) transhydrogenase n=1 Tax=Persicobacter psychrovividus TaxID=387638 RepID=A0ABM7VF06_9BACT|nr:NAD(P) transhydrogenase subunit alpha [Persicobacter psychrovividus]
MRFGILKELTEKRVAITPDFVKKLVAQKHEVVFEKGCGEGAALVDELFVAEGAKAADRAEVLAAADVITTIIPLPESDLDQVKKGAVLISQFQPFADDSICEKLASKGLTALSMDMIPRSTIAQAMDVLSSMASIAGYKAVLTAADHLPRYMPMLSTAAGTIRPAKMLVLGAGVAGLQAIATGRRLGAMVEAFDTRAAAKEEVMSLGAKFVEVEGASDDKAAGGYAVEQTEEYKQRQADLIFQKVSKADIVITTAQLRGRPAPLLVNEEMLKAMPQGAVLIDLAASTGGNVAFSKHREVVKTHGVTIVGNSELADEVPEHASQLFSRNVENFLKHKDFLSEEGFSFDFEEDIFGSACIVYNGEVRFGAPALTK